MTTPNTTAPVELGASLLRNANDVDLTKARPSCRRCHGVGITGHLLKDDQRIPIVCRCVVRNGGVQASAPKSSDLTSPQATADEIVNTALRLPHNMLPMCIRSLEKLHDELPTDQKQSGRALALVNARRVLVQRMLQQEGAPMPAQEETT